MMTLSNRLPKSLAALLLLASVILAPLAAATAQGVRQGSDTKLPVPRFVSLKSDAVHVRRGPSRDHEVIWRYVRSGLPVEVTQEFENWRRIRDFEGAEGWVFHSLLSGTRTALVAPWDKSAEPMRIYAEPGAVSAVTAMLEPGVQAVVTACDGNWCRLQGSNFSGWIEQESLWGVYPNEVFD